MMSIHLPIVPFDITSYAARRAERTASYGVQPGETKRVGSLRVQHLDIPPPPAPNMHPALPQEVRRTNLTAWRVHKHSLHSITEASAPLTQDQFDLIKPFDPRLENLTLEQADQALLANTGTTGRGHSIQHLLLKRQNPVTLDDQYADHITKHISPGNAQMIVENTTNSIAVVPTSSNSQFRAFNTSATMYDIPSAKKNHPDLIAAEDAWRGKEKDLEAAKLEGDAEKIEKLKKELHAAGRVVAEQARAQYRPTTQASIKDSTRTSVANLVRTHLASRRSAASQSS